MSKVDIYTDGACKGNPGPGGWGAWLIAGENSKELCGGELNTTNNRMELMAVIEALNALNRSCDVVVHTDSQYVQKGISEWLEGWKARGWRTASKAPVKNVDLWMALDEAQSRHTIATNVPMHWPIEALSCCCRQCLMRVLIFSRTCFN